MSLAMALAVAVALLEAGTFVDQNPLPSVLVVFGGALSGAGFARMWQGSLAERTTANMLAYPVALALCFAIATLHEWTSGTLNYRSDLVGLIFSIPIAAFLSIIVAIMAEPAILLPLMAGLVCAEHLPRLFRKPSS